VRESDDGTGVCTKYNYALVRLFGNDEVALLRALARNGGTLP